MLESEIYRTLTRYQLQTPASNSSINTSPPYRLFFRMKGMISTMDNYTLLDINSTIAIKNSKNEKLIRTLKR